VLPPSDAAELAAAELAASEQCRKAILRTPCGNLQRADWDSMPMTRRDSTMTTQEEFMPALGEESTQALPLDFAPGDLVEGRRGGRLLHRGRVTDVAPHQGLLWIMDTVSGSRRLLDSSEVDIIRLSELEIA
jgi:hypothetical protein